MAAVAEAFEGVRAKLVRAVKQQESNGVAHAVRLGDVLTEGESGQIGAVLSFEAAVCSSAAADAAVRKSSYPQCYLIRAEMG